MTAEERVTAFLYILMRDHLPTGTVRGIVQEAEDMQGKPRFTNEGLAMCSRQYSGKLLSDLTQKG